MINDYFVLRGHLIDSDKHGLYIDLGLYRRDTNERKISFRQSVTDTDFINNLDVAINNLLSKSSISLEEPDDWGSDHRTILFNYIDYKSKQLEVLARSQGKNFDLSKALYDLECWCINLTNRVNSISNDELASLVSISDLEMNRYEETGSFNIDLLMAKMDIFKFIKKPNSEIQKKHDETQRFLESIAQSMESKPKGSHSAPS